MSLNDLRVLTAVLCEEVRQEANGKSVIVGAMAEGPEVSDDEPTPISRLAVYLEIEMGAERTPIELRLVRGDDEPAMKVVLDSEQMYEEMPPVDTWERSPIGVIVFGREYFKLQGSGVYELQVSTKQDEWKKCRDFFFPAKTAEQ